jgi:hypothetical protein
MRENPVVAVLIQRTLGNNAERAFCANEQLCYIKASRGFAGALARFNDLSGRQNNGLRMIEVMGTAFYSFLASMNRVQEPLSFRGSVSNGVCLKEV